MNTIKKSPNSFLYGHWLMVLIFQFALGVIGEANAATTYQVSPSMGSQANGRTIYARLDSITGNIGTFTIGKIGGSAFSSSSQFRVFKNNALIRSINYSAGNYVTNFSVDLGTTAGGATYQVRRFDGVSYDANVMSGNISVTTANTPAPTADDYGNSVAAATRISLNTNYNGALGTEGDLDFFRINPSSAGSLTVYTTGSTDTFGYLYNSAGTQIASNDDANGSANFGITYNVPAAGTFYVAVKHYSSTGVGSYALRANFSGKTLPLPLTAPLLSSPANNATGLASATFTWQSVPNATSYEVVISQDSAFSCNGTCNGQISAATQYTKPSFSLPNTRYYWRVRAINGSGAGSWSAVRTLTSAVIANPFLARLDSFVTTKSGNRTDMDGSYGAQCVDLMHAYIQDVLTAPFTTHGLRGNAYSIYANAASSTTLSTTLFGAVRLDKIVNTPTGAPKKGDIVFWNRAKSNGQAGHVAIFIDGNASSFRSIDQNWVNSSATIGSAAAIVTHNYTGVAGWLHPVDIPN